MRGHFIFRLLPAFACGVVANCLVGSLHVAAGQTGSATTSLRTPFDEEESRESLLKQRDAHWQDAKQLVQRQKLDEAVLRYEAVIRLQKQIFGANATEVTEPLAQFAGLHLRREDIAAATKVCDEVLAIRIKSLGSDHWQTIDARQAQAECAQFAKLNSTDRQQWLCAAESLDHAKQCRMKNAAADAAQFAGKAAKLFAEVAGREHALTGTALFDQGMALVNLGHPDQAIPLLKQAAEIREKTLGIGHPATAATLKGLGDAYHDRFDNVSAIAPTRRALEIYEKVLGPEQSPTVFCVNDLAVLYYSIGDAKTALPFCQRAVAVRTKVLGEDHLHTSLCLNNLSDIYYSLGDFSAASAACQRALKIREKALGPEHPLVARSQCDLAEIYSALADHKSAFALYQTALDIRRKTLGPEHPETANSLHNLASCCQAKGDSASALDLFLQALRIHEQKLGENHRDTASCQVSLARLYQAQGKYDAALTLYERALKTHKTTSKFIEPTYLLQSLNNLAVLHLAQGNAHAALPMTRQGQAVGRKHLEAVSAVQSERQQLILQTRMRAGLDLFLSAACTAKQDAAACYEPVLAWKGATFVRQQRIRSARKGLQKHPEAAKLFADLEAKSRTLAALSNAPITSRRVDERIQLQARLSQEIESIERQLAEVSREYRNTKATANCRVGDLQQVLPAKTALVDLIEYEHYGSVAAGKLAPAPERRLLAFVLRHDQPLRCIDLGPAAKIQAAVHAWRSANLPEEMPDEAVSSSVWVALWNSLAGPSKAPEQKLREFIWDKLSPHFEQCDTVLISPDGAVAGFPWAALPGRQAGKFLLEEIAIAVVPVPQALPDLLSAVGSRAVTAPSLLLVGEVHLAGDPGEPALASEAHLATVSKEKNQRVDAQAVGAEIDAVHKLFETSLPRGKVVRLSHNQPTEQAVRDAVHESNFVHFGTHGYFAKPPSRAAEGSDWFEVSEFMINPDLLCGLALVGANGRALPHQDDGILTALEVKSLNLEQAEMVVLSACQTAMGVRAAGEGVFSLQTAFHMAGARSSLASLWNVPDRSTCLLMTEFYDNLWTKKMSRIEAIRHAQLKVLREGLRLGALGAVGPMHANKRLPPLFWAGFVLAGDWR